jgi:DNA-binding GntR family transcriptional regulator
MTAAMGELADIGEAGPGEAAEAAPESVYQRLRGDILGGRLTANERLKVSTLAARYRTSTNPVREALQQLRGEGLVVIEPNRGARVRTIDEAFVRDIFEIEVLVEPYLTRLFVNQCTAADIDRLEDLQARIEALNFADPGQHSILDAAFHRLMYDRHYNRHAVDLWWRHREILHAINVGHGISLRRQRDVIDEHRALIQALREHDEARTVALITRHIQGSGRHIIERMRVNRATTP